MSQIDWSHVKNLVLLSGAGISAASGIATFRGSGGLWENHRIEDVATPEAFNQDPQLVWRFYSMRRLQAGHAKPNEAHKALDAFAEKFNGEITLITQNVDGLHRRAQKKSHLDAICMHGTLEKSRCTHCHEIYLDDMAWLPSEGMPRQTGLLRTDEQANSDALSNYKIKLSDGLPLSPCCQELLRPHIVWFGEEPLFMPKIFASLERCDLFASIGTSGVVYPAAAFLEIAKSHGAETVLFNVESLPQQEHVDLYIQGPAEETVPQQFSL
ncbi:MAG: NAD-dependent protein deacylase [Bacteriovoracaceae bacterium]|nr:NAD-dependent protein deacylase [Bacteriovoracaceae bacterium]